MTAQRIFIASLATESNSFSPIPTGARAFAERAFPGRATDSPPALMTEALHVWRSRAEAARLPLTESIAAAAAPAGAVVRAVWEQFRDEILSDFAAAGGAEIVLLQLHGAMIAEGCDDCEGTLLAELRKAAPDAVMGALLDPHCHLTPAMCAAADLLLTFREYPHTDAAERAEDLFRLAVDTRAGRIAPVMAVADCRMVGTYFTSRDPVRALIADMEDAERSPGSLSLSFVHGFPWGDVADNGTRVLAISNGDRSHAQRLAESFAARIYRDRVALSPPFPDLDTALDTALAEPKGPVVLADMADNAGGGAPSDSTFVLRALLDRGVTGAALGLFWDPVAVRLCHEAGVGARLTLRLGGKLGPVSGTPVDLDATVRATGTDLWQTFGGARMPMGDAAWIEAEGLDIVATGLRTQCFHPDAFTGLGLPIANRHLIVVKSTNHFAAGFAPVAQRIVHAATPGALDVDFSRLCLTKRAEPFWPRHSDPWPEADA